MRVATLLLVAAALLAPGAPARAACALVVVNGGVMSLSADATTLATDAGGVALPATVTVANTGLGDVTVTIGAPQWVAYPPDFDSGGAEIDIAYTGTGLLGSVGQPYTDAPTSFVAPALLGVATALTLQSRIVAPSGFRSGTYTTRTTITCS